MSEHHLPTLPYGAVYYRRSNPPRQDWERDYQTASDDGMNAFRHWFMWGVVEVKPGVFNWEPYDRQLDLAARHGMKTVIAEMCTAAPEWAFRSLAHARYQTADGHVLHSEMGGSAAVGGFQGLCLDNPDAQEAAGRFLRELASQYCGHSALGGYDVWNECNIRPHICYCDATQERFREWLQNKYGDLETVNEVWHRYSFASWDDVAAPRTLGPYPDSLDWLQFRIDNAHRLMRWRIDLIREIDPDHTIIAHGVAQTLASLATSAADDWRAAAEVEIYGFTWGSSRQGDEPWKQYHAVDLIRSASKEKEFWHAESFGGPLWMQPQVIGKPRDEGRIPTPEDIRFWDMVSLAGGSRGVFRPRWRPLLDGPLFGAFGPYGMDGSRTPLSEMVRTVGNWMHQHEVLLQSRPVRGEVGILVVPEAQIFTYAQQGSTEFFSAATKGAYQGFFENNIQADWIRLDQLSDYDFVYLPFPIMLESNTVQAIRGWVEEGGILVAEGCPAYFGDHGHVGEVQPNFGLDEMFGATESYVEFTPDLLDDLVLSVGGQSIQGGLFLQAYSATTGTPIGTYADGRIAAVENDYGRGRTLLVGTFPGYGHGLRRRNREPGCAGYFAWLLGWAGKSPHIKITDPRVTARLQQGASGHFVWLTNPTRTCLPVQIEIDSSFGPFSQANAAWGEGVECSGTNRLSVTVAARDAVVLELA